MSYNHLTLLERETISQMGFCGHGVRSIARTLRRAPSTISRELTRNGSAHGRYSAVTAHRRSVDRRRQRPVSCKLDHGELQAEVRRGLGCCWSPEEISGRLRREQRGHDRMQVSHQTIYRWLWSNPRIYEQFSDDLRHRRYRKRGRAGRDIPIRNRRSIHSRPTIVSNRTRVGDWEGDTVVGRRHSRYVATFVERRTGYLLARVIKNRRSATLNRAVERAFRNLPRGLRHSLTVDNGTEFAAHERLTRRLGPPIYFADPYTPCQHGTNENTNGLLRQFLPKHCGFSDLGRIELEFHVSLLNNRPRKRLNYRTPAEVFNEARVALEV